MIGDNRSAERRACVQRGVTLTSQVRETRRSVKDSVTGEQKEEIGHSIGDRSHVITRTRNQQTGATDEEHNFVNLSEGTRPVCVPIPLRAPWEPPYAPRPPYEPFSFCRVPSAASFVV